MSDESEFGLEDECAYLLARNLAVDEASLVVVVRVKLLNGLLVKRLLEVCSMSEVIERRTVVSSSCS